MTQYINKDALVAEIKRRKEINKYRDTPDSLFEDEGILSFITSLEVKEVNLNDEKCKDLNDDGTCIYAANKTGKLMRCEYINCFRKIKAQKGKEEGHK